MSQSLSSGPWIAGISGAAATAVLSWLRGFARRARPEDLAAVETRLGKRIDDGNEEVKGEFSTVRSELRVQQDRFDRQIGEVHKRLDDLFKSLGSPR